MENNEGIRYKVEKIDKVIKNTKREIGYYAGVGIALLMLAGANLHAATTGVELPNILNMDPTYMFVTYTVLGCYNLYSARKAVENLVGLTIEPKTEEKEGRAR